MTSPAEILGYIAKHEPLEKTLGRFPEVTRERLCAILREAALLMHAEQSGVCVVDPVADSAVDPVPVAAPPTDSQGAPSSVPRSRPPAPMAPTAMALPLAPPAKAPSPSVESNQSVDKSAPVVQSSRFLQVFSDGASRGNPGPAGAGAVLVKADGTVVAKCGKFLGSQTNNYAEYMGLILGLQTAQRLGANEVEIVADSELMVRQLQGAYRVKNEGLKPLYEQVRELMRGFKKTSVRHVPREQNKLADEMSNRAIDEKM